MTLVALAAYVIVGPLAVARYPLMTDLPFHSANASILGHYADPAWHFREQFELRPLRVPYLSSYVVAAVLMLGMSAVSATKVAVALMLALVPLGLAVLCWGMGKSPLLGAWALVLAWGNLATWGFVNHLGALGLFAMILGVALRLMRPLAPRARSRLELVLTLLVVCLFFTHPFRFPFALAALAVVPFASRSIGRFPSLARALAVGVVLFALWWWRQPAQGAAEWAFGWEPARLEHAHAHLFASFRNPSEDDALAGAARWLVGTALGCALVGRFGVSRPALDRRHLRRASLLVLGAALAFLALYLSLPMSVGLWWYIYPRELSAALLVALALLPDLPRVDALRLIAAWLMVLALAPLGSLVIDHHRRFDVATRDFDGVAAHVPAAPKLLYLVFDHDGAGVTKTPFLHLPAYIQAERGGWLSFHFAMWEWSPVVYRSRDEAGAVVPPPVPLRWEWTPERFSVRRHGSFFEWFLVRRRTAPSELFVADPEIGLVAHRGSWWLYRRRARPAMVEPPPAASE
jgi:hypothetical protein